VLATTARALAAKLDACSDSTSAAAAQAAPRLAAQLVDVLGGCETRCRASRMRWTCPCPRATRNRSAVRGAWDAATSEVLLIDIQAALGNGIPYKVAGPISGRPACAPRAPASWSSRTSHVWPHVVGVRLHRAAR
jgi:hypothetical protein